MKPLFTFLLLCAGLLGASFTGIEPTYVYICDSSNAHAYHYKKDCRGLSRCKHKVLKVTLEDAKAKHGRKLCGWED